MCQNDPEQGFIPRGAAAQVAQPYKAGRNGDLLLYNLKEKKSSWLLSVLIGRQKYCMLCCLRNT